MHPTEREVQLEMLDSLLSVPHRKLDELRTLHLEAARADPVFYARLAAWYHRHGEVRDHADLFTATLLTSDALHHRGVGVALLGKLPPHRVSTLVDFMKKSLGKVPRSTRTAVETYLRRREADPSTFDRAVLRSRTAMKHLYATLHIKPNDRAEAILFRKAIPEDSLLNVVKRLGEADTPEQAAELIVKHDVPYPVAVGALKRLTPVVAKALLNVMTPAEVVTNLASLKARGMWTDPETKALIESKLVEAGAGETVVPFKARLASDLLDSETEFGRRIDEAAARNVREKGEIKKSVAVFIDKSSSMSAAIKVGGHIVTMISQMCRDKLVVYAFDEVACPVVAEGEGVGYWKRAFANIEAGGGTSIGSALEALRLKKVFVEQILIVTDGKENSPPFFMDVFEAYSREAPTTPKILLIKIGTATEEFERRLRQLGIEVESFLFRGDYYALPNLIPYLTKPTKRDLLAEILNTPLPTV